MARSTRLAIAGLPHLVALYALPGVDLIPDPADAERARAILIRVAADERVAVHGYGIGPQRVAWLATPSQAAQLSRLVQGFGRHYVSAYNRRYDRSGTLFAGRFRAAVVDPEQYAVLALQEAEFAAEEPSLSSKCGFATLLDPRGGRAGRSPAPGALSSRAHHCGIRREPWLTPLPAYWGLGNTPFDRERVWAEGRLDMPADWPERLRHALGSGGAMGSPAFLAHCAEMGGQSLHRRPRGRPPAGSRMA